MKKIILFALLAFLFQGSFSQTKERRGTEKKETLRDKSIKKHLKEKRGSKFVAKLAQSKLYKAGKQSLISQVDEELDTIKNMIVNTFKTEFTYDASERKTSELNYDWNSTSSIWDKSDKNDYSFDSKGNVTSVLNLTWNGSSWDNFYKDDYTYNIDNDQLTDYYYEWDDVGNKWLEVYKIEFTYDVNHHVLTNTYWEWDGSKYALFDQLSYTYDANGNLLTDSYSTWNDAITKYVPVDRYKYSYDSKNNRDTSLYGTWNQTGRKYISESRDVYDYDANNNMLTDVYAEWVTNIWTDVARTVNLYDLKNNRTFSTDQDYDSKRSKWVNAYQEQNVYDGTVSRSELILPYDDETMNIFFKTKYNQANEYEWNTTNLVWDKYAITTYNYKSGTESIGEQGKKTNISVYPNPAVGKAYVNIRNYSGSMGVKIYDMAGKLIQTKEIPNDGFIDVEGFKSGVYFLQISDGPNVLGNLKLFVD